MSCCFLCSGWILENPGPSGVENYGQRTNSWDGFGLNQQIPQVEPLLPG